MSTTTTTSSSSSSSSTAAAAAAPSAIAAGPSQQHPPPQHNQNSNSESPSAHPRASPSSYPANHITGAAAAVSSLASTLSFSSNSSPSYPRAGSDSTTTGAPLDQNHPQTNGVAGPTGAHAMDVDPSVEDPAESSAKAKPTLSIPAPLTSLEPPPQNPMGPHSTTKILRDQPSDIVVPTFASWFSFSSISDIEKKSLPEFFSNRNKSKTPQVYKDYRDFMINTYRMNPDNYLTVTACRRNLAGDVCAIIRVHSFLEQWGLINYQVVPDSRPSAIVPPYTGHFRVTADTPKGLQPDSLKRRQTALSKVFGQAPTLSHSFFGTLAPNPKRVKTEPSLSTDQSKTSDPVQTPSNAAEKPPQRISCHSCGVDCTSLRYHAPSSLPTPPTDGSYTEGGIDICKNCFLDGRFPSDLFSGDFLRMEEKASHHTDSAPWTSQETLLLLEAIEMFGDESESPAKAPSSQKGPAPSGPREFWAKVSKHVGTRSREQCIYKFLEIPIEAPFYHGPNEKRTESSLGAFQFLDTPYSAADNPVLSVLSMLATAIKPEVARETAKAAVQALRHQSGGKSAAANKEKEDSMEVDGSSPARAVKSEDKETLAKIKVATDEAVEASGPGASPFEKAGAIVFGASAAKAAAIAQNETAEVRRLTLRVLDLQVQKMNLKLKHFEELERVIETEQRHIEQERRALEKEREAFKRDREALHQEKEQFRRAKEARAAAAAQQQHQSTLQQQQQLVPEDFVVSSIPSGGGMLEQAPAVKTVEVPASEYEGGGAAAVVHSL
ncbi:SWIRM domain-containing protein [Zopfochytrium polystomum]|nr:SWIRM domain-containing protein [Zopfochytrium polystomum]